MGRFHRPTMLCIKVCTFLSLSNEMVTGKNSSINSYTTLFYSFTLSSSPRFSITLDSFVTSFQDTTVITSSVSRFITSNLLLSNLLESNLETFVFVFPLSCPTDYITSNPSPPLFLYSDMISFLKFLFLSLCSPFYFSRHCFHHTCCKCINITNIYQRNLNVEILIGSVSGPFQVVPTSCHI